MYLSSLSTGTEKLRFGRNGRNSGEFNCVSGVSIDGGGNMLIGDAKNNRIQVTVATDVTGSKSGGARNLRVLQLFDMWGQYVTQLRLEAPAPYQYPCSFISDIHLTSDGQLMIVSRAKHVVNIFSLYGVD